MSLREIHGVNMVGPLFKFTISPQRSIFFGYNLGKFTNSSHGVPPNYPHSKRFF